MEALIFDGSKEGDEVLRIAHNVIKQDLKRMGWKVNSFTLREIRIAPCRGCFDCWLKTPGICITNDAGRHTTSVAVCSDLWIFITPITFGGYSSELKKAIDRILPIFIPVFTKVDGEVHHRLRYEKHPTLIGVGRIVHEGEDYKNTFRKLIARNAINFRSPHHIVEILLPNYTIEQIKGRLTKTLLELKIMK